MDKEPNHGWMERGPADSSVNAKALSLILMLLRFAGFALMKRPFFLATSLKVAPAKK